MPPPRIWLTADPHFGHGNIIEYCGRPFSSPEEMDYTLMKNYNTEIAPNDLVYCLGDFAFRNHRHYLDRLRGKWHLIIGNHDGNDYRNGGFVWCKETYQLKFTNETIFLSHFAHRVWNRSHFGAFHAYGHTHGTLENYGRSMDVGVDAHSFRPVEITEFIRTLTPFRNHDQLDLLRT